MIIRSKLKEIYDGLPNAEKKKWAKNSGYSSYQGLYKYLSRKGDSNSAFHIINALIKTIGNDRFEDLNKSNYNSKNNHQINRLLEKIFNDNSDDARRFKIFTEIADQNNFDYNRFLELETAMTDLLKQFPDNDELVEKIRTATSDIITIVILRSFIKKETDLT